MMLTLTYGPFFFLKYLHSSYFRMQHLKIPGCQFLRLFIFIVKKKKKDPLTNRFDWNLP